MPKCCGDCPLYAHVPAVEAAVATADLPDRPPARDRARFVPYRDAAERFAHDRGLVVGGAAATRLLLGAPPPPPSGGEDVLELYSASPLVDARGLADALAAEGPEGETTSMATVVARQEFLVSVDERPLVRVLALPPAPVGRGTSAGTPSRCRTSRGVVLRCMGPEVQLVAAYAALCDPARAGEWPALAGAERALRALFAAEIADKIARVGGAAPRPKRSRLRHQGRPSPALAEVAAALLREVVGRGGRVLVGRAAAALLAGEPFPSAPYRLQVVSGNVPKEDEEDVRRAAAAAGVEIAIVRSRPRIPTDDRLGRTTVYVLRPGEPRAAVLDIYDAARYRLVPYTTREVGGATGEPALRARVGSPYAVLALLLVDVWVVQLLAQAKAADAGFARRTLREYAAAVEAVGAAADRLLAAKEFDAVFPGDAIGQREDPVIAEKRRRYAEIEAGRSRPYPPYYPAAREASGGGDIGESSESGRPAGAPHDAPHDALYDALYDELYDAPAL